MKPSIDPSDLRDHAIEARVERVWERLESNLTGELGGPRARHASKRTGFYVAAALAAGFAGGIGVSNWPRSLGPSTPLAESRDAPPSREPSTASPSLAAGRRADTPALPRDSTSGPRPRASASARPGLTNAERGSSADAAPAWVVACANYDYDKAYELLDAQGGVGSALQQATNDQRLCLASGSRQRNQPELAKLALQGVADDSSDPDRAAIAAAQLARIFEDEGNTEEQRRYEQLKEIRSKGRLLSEPALCEKLKVQAEVGAHRTVLELARQYENQYPSGTCAATVQALEAAAKAKLAAAESAASSADDDADGDSPAPTND